MLKSIQLDLFNDAPASAIPLAPPSQKVAPITSGSEPVVRLRLGPKLAARPPRRPLPSRLLADRDMPNYSQEEIAEVDRVIAEMKSNDLLLGYRDIQNLFGVSKATANRRMKDGLVPGVKIQDGVVRRDGGVRRFSREQVKWLLLAVRSNQHRRTACTTGAGVSSAPGAPSGFAETGMRDIVTCTSDAVASVPDSVVSGAIRLVRVLARQAAREDHERALEAARTKPRLKQPVRRAPKAAEED